MSALTSFEVVTEVEEACTCCWDGCGVPIFMAPATERRFHRNHNFFHCINGHSQHFSGESDIEKERRLRTEAENDAERERLWNRNAQRREEAARRSAAAYRGHLTRVKRRVGKGVCPCCNRTFKNLADHMDTKHPDYADE